MILECPECRTRYLVPDSAIGPDGRTVRCASCKHSWFQAAPVLDLVARAEAQAASPASATQPERYVPPVADSRPTDDENYDAFAHRPPFRPRRNPARRRTIAAIVAGVVMIAGVGAIATLGSGDLGSLVGLPLAQRETPLRLIDNPIERRDLDNGSEMFAISGKVVNPTNVRQHVPDIRAELHDAQGRLVYSWTIRPEATELPPKGSVAFNSAKLDVPVNSKQLVLSFAADSSN
jgi:predicted Zn finger-like uncharacterized protein